MANLSSRIPSRIQSYGNEFSGAVICLYQFFFSFFFVVVNFYKGWRNCEQLLFCDLEFHKKMHEPRHDKMCLWEFPTRPDTSRPAQPQKLAKVLKFWL